MFEEILKVCPSFLELSSKTAQKNYLVVPIGVFPSFDPPEAFINFELAQKVIGARDASQEKLEWPSSVEDIVVTKGHMPGAGLYEVLEVDSDVTPCSPFPEGQFGSYADYYQTKYHVTITDFTQPSLVCKQIGFSESRLRMITSRFKDTHGDELSQSTSKYFTEVLFAELVCKYPLPSSFVKVIRCVPSLLWRIENFLLVDELRETISVGVGINETFITCTHFRGYQDYGLPEMTEAKATLDLESYPDDRPILYGPDNPLLLQALTVTAANDSINNERLETLGDSFLKLATSVYLFCERPSAHEGRLTSARIRRIDNRNLYFLAKRNKIMGRILSKKFSPKEMWVPPCYVFREHEASDPQRESGDIEDEMAASKYREWKYQYMYHKVTNKGAADCIESLIGAYLVAGGMEAALGLMKWLGLKIVRTKSATDLSDQDMLSEGEVESSSSSSSLSAPEPKKPRSSIDQEDEMDLGEDKFTYCSSRILLQHFGPLPPSFFNESKKADIMKLLQISRGSLQPQYIEDVINWTFQDPALLLQALTHASYQRNRVTDCYQRLEFLGDAVLDYLITIYVYQTFPDFDPGKITEMRSALVNNNLFAELAVKLQLHKVFLHNSPSLFKLIPEYENTLAAVSSQNPDTAAEKEIIEYPLKVHVNTYYIYTYIQFLLYVCMNYSTVVNV